MQGVAGFPLAALLADPVLARAAADSLERATIATRGGRSVSAALARPDRAPAPAVLLVHEWWGLNEQIKSVALDLSHAGFLALAADLYGGKATADAETARTYVRAVDREEATDTLVSWIEWLRRHANGTGRVATIGWCFGGGWSLSASIAAPVDATVVYYGNVDRTVAELARLRGPVLGHFATRDRNIDAEMVGGFGRRMRAAGKALALHWYEADHGFANPTSAIYDEGDAALAWERTLSFLKANLG